MNSGPAMAATIPCACSAAAIVPAGRLTPAGGTARARTKSCRPSAAARNAATPNPSGPLMSVGVFGPRFSSMITNRNSTMIAPAYTSTWSTATNCASRITDSAAS